MNKKKLLVLFIISFISVLYTANSLCDKYIDTRINNVFIQKNIQQESIQQKIVLNKHAKLLITISAALVSLAVFVFATRIAAMAYLVFFIIAYFISYKIALNNFVFINIAGVFLAILFAKYFADIYIHLFKENVNKKIENVLGKYISSDIKNKILKSSTEVALGGKRQEITIMFADIRGFTSLSESRKAEEVSQLLNEYFSELEPIITKYKGVINKFIGDAVLVVFGDPSADKMHAKNAVKCAYELRNKVKEIKQKWIEEGKPKIDIGIGINTGEAFIGNVGTKNRFEYTVIGDTVNIASRIEDYNKIYKTHILISENTYNKISQIVDVIKIREVSIKGKSHKINIYEVLRITE